MAVFLERHPKLSWCNLLLVQGKGPLLAVLSNLLAGPQDPLIPQQKGKPSDWQIIRFREAAIGNGTCQTQPLTLWVWRGC